RLVALGADPLLENTKDRTLLRNATLFPETMENTPLSLAIAQNRPKVFLAMLESKSYRQKYGWRNNTPLHDAVSFVCESAVELILKDPLMVKYVNQRDWLGRTPLFMAAENNLERSVHQLLLHGADATAKDRHGVTPLHIAAKSSFNPAIFNLLLEHGANPNALNSEESFDVPPAYSPGMLFMKKMENIKAYGFDFQYKPIRHACMKILQLLLKHGMNINSILQDNNNNIPLLHWAVSFLPASFIKLLLKAGADLNIMDNKSRSAVFHVVDNEFSLEVLSVLLDAGTNPNAQDRNKDTPLIVFCRSCAAPQAMKRLIMAGADVNLANRKDLTPLHALCMSTDESSLKFAENLQPLLDEGASVNAQDYYGNTPLHYAAQYQNNHNLSLFISKASPLLELSNAQGKTPLHLAALKSNKLGYDSNANDNVVCLLAAGAKVNVMDNAGNTPLHLAAKSNFPATYSALVDAGADTQAKNYNGQTPESLLQSS
ncbi:MAG: ankyrin repeat domain-containing protein, partial [Victivallales bacterium]|nr:ankyrin repeat domain-containing protein [Victivallales bacterium]